MLTFLNIYSNMRIENIHSHCYMKGDLSKMTVNEMELIKLIRESDNFEQALMTATVIILGFLKQHGSSEEPAPAYLREHV